MSEFINKYKIIIFLSFLVIVLIIIKIKYGQLNTIDNETLIPTTTLIPTPIPTIDEFSDPEGIYENTSAVNQN